MGSMVADHVSCAVVILGGCLGYQNIAPACPNHLCIDQMEWGLGDAKWKTACKQLICVKSTNSR